MIKTYTVLENKRYEITKKVNMLYKKSLRCGCNMSVTYSDPYYKEYVVYSDSKYDDFITQSSRPEVKPFEVFDITLDADEFKLGDYEVVAEIEHEKDLKSNEYHNIVNYFSKNDDDFHKEWYNIPPKCEHCNGNHNQKKTFMVKDSNGDYKQIGKTCLKLYCGINPQFVIGLNDFNGYMDNEEMRDYVTMSDSYSSHLIEFRTVLAAAFKVFDEQGYIKSNMDNSNKSKIISLIKNDFNENSETKKWFDKADDAIELYKNFEADDSYKDMFIISNFEDMKSYSYNKYCKNTHYGYIAYAPMAIYKYEKYMEEFQAKIEKNNAEKKSSDYVGAVGEKIEIDIKSMEQVASFSNNFGSYYDTTSTMWKIIDVNGNVYMWTTSSYVSGDWKKLKGTVKDHKEYKGVKQTILKRCSKIS